MTEQEALDEAAKAAGWPNGWGEASRFAPNNLFNAIRAHAATITENAALKAENKRLREALGEICRDSNPDWTEKRVYPNEVLDDIHTIAVNAYYKVNP